MKRNPNDRYARYQVYVKPSNDPRGGRWYLDRTGRSITKYRGDRGIFVCEMVDHYAEDYLARYPKDKLEIVRDYSLKRNMDKRRNPKLKLKVRPKAQIMKPYGHSDFDKQLENYGVSSSR